MSVAFATRPRTSEFIPEEGRAFTDEDLCPPDLDSLGTYDDPQEEPGEETAESISQEYDCEFIKDICRYARDSITHFFEGRTLADGSPVWIEPLLSDERIDMVLQTTVSAASRTAYEGMHGVESISKKEELQGVPAADVRLFWSILNECASLGIPKSFSGGIALLCLEVCEGIEIPYHRVFYWLAEEFGEDGWYIEYVDTEDAPLSDASNFSLDDLIIDYGLPQ